MAMAKQIKMTDSQFAKMRKIVYDRAGIWFSDAKKYVLESRLSRRLEELEMDDFDQYCVFLTIGPYREDEFQEMFNRITINETSFFRNEPQLEVFERKILTQLLESRKSSRRLRIWSAACSTGEEPYTIAIMIHRTLGLRLGDWQIEILGTDISEKALLVAESGTYQSYATRTVKPLVMHRYFKSDKEVHQLAPEIQAMVQFERHNLKEHFAAKRHGMWDVIFCRNVMIYFDQPMRDGCIKMFYDQLEKDGTLFIGHSETIRDSKFFAARAEPYAFAYNKLAQEGVHAAA